jgi:hypothetical protein
VCTQKSSLSCNPKRPNKIIARKEVLSVDVSKLDTLKLERQPAQSPAIHEQSIGEARHCNMRLTLRCFMGCLRAPGMLLQLVYPILDSSSLQQSLHAIVSPIGAKNRSPVCPPLAAGIGHGNINSDCDEGGRAEHCHCHREPAPPLTLTDASWQSDAPS